MLNWFLKKINNRKGFTLIELIVVIAILGILAAIAIPRLGGFTDQAKIAADKELAATIAHAATIYAANNGSVIPTTVKTLVDADLINADDVLVKSKLYGGPTAADASATEATTKVSIIQASAAITAVVGTATEPAQPAVAKDQYYVDLSGHVAALIN